MTHKEDEDNTEENPKEFLFTPKTIGGAQLLETYRVDGDENFGIEGEKNDGGDDGVEKRVECHEVEDVVFIQS